MWPLTWMSIEAASGELEHSGSAGAVAADVVDAVIDDGVRLGRAGELDGEVGVAFEKGRMGPSLDQRGVSPASSGRPSPGRSMPARATSLPQGRVIHPVKPGEPSVPEDDGGPEVAGKR